MKEGGKIMKRIANAEVLKTKTRVDTKDWFRNYRKQNRK